MKTTRSVIILAALLLSAGFAVRATAERLKTDTALSALAADRSTLREKTARLDARLRANREAMIRLEKEKTELAATRPPPASPKPGREVTARSTFWTNNFRGEVSVVNDARKGAAYASNLRESFPLTYAGLFQSLALPPAKVAEFTDVLVWLEMSRLDLIATMDSQHVDATAAEYKKAWDEWFTLRRTKLAEVLGDRAERFREYEKIQPAHQLAVRLASSAAYSDAPITPAQIERVATILAANSNRAVTTNLMVKGTINWPAAREQLADVVASAQVEVLGYFVESETADAKLNDVRRRLSAKLKAAPPAK